MVAVEKSAPVLTDHLGAALCLAGAAAILSGAAGAGRRFNLGR
jgi:drug/metabolite transporter superfamily protein YnfA